MKRSIRIFTVVSLLILVSLACAIPGSLPTSNPQDALGTLVAANLTALAQDLPLGITEVPPTVESIPASPTIPPVPAVLRVTYIKDNNAWLWTDGIGAIQLSMSGDVRDAFISSDGQIVAYRREIGPFNHEIWAVNNDSSNSRLLVSSADFMAAYSGSAADIPSGVSAYQFGWQPGTHNLFYNTRPLYEGPGFFGYDDLHIV
ncbi:MAG: hypothetical protein MIO92_06040, partial [Methanosarcinaceae archaeon]|nr:hypothetical protein [Methanosarcinaceae archaeon]